MLAVAGGAFGFMLMDDDPPVIATDMRIEPNPAPAGTTTWRIVQFYRKRSCETHVKQMVFAGEHGARRIVLPDLFFQAELLPLGPDRAMIEIVLPENAPPGPAIHRALNTYRCNWAQRWVRPIRVPPRDISFTIAPRP